jgi:hypothetical protein
MMSAADLAALRRFFEERNGDDEHIPDAPTRAAIPYDPDHDARHAKARALIASTRALVDRVNNNLVRAVADAEVND